MAQIIRNPQFNFYYLSIYLSFFFKSRDLGPRRYLYDGVLEKTKSNKKLHAFLFNDMLLVVRHHISVGGGYEYIPYREPIPVNALLARDIPKESPESPNFQIIQVRTQVSFPFLSALLVCFFWSLPSPGKRNSHCQGAQCYRKKAMAAWDRLCFLFLSGFLYPYFQTTDLFIIRAPF